MSKYYCMCQITGDVPRQARDSQGFGPSDNQVFLAANRFGKYDEKDHPENGDLRPVILQRSMECIKNGVRQKITGEPVPNRWPRTLEEIQKDMKAIDNAREHFRNVDLYKCPMCGAMMCVE